VGLTQSLLQWISAVVLCLATHFHLLPSRRMHGTSSSCSLHTFMAWCFSRWEIYLFFLHVRLYIHADMSYVFCVLQEGSTLSAGLPYASNCRCSPGFSFLSNSLCWRAVWVHPVIWQIITMTWRFCKSNSLSP
jgi:hypothetical protein